MSGVMEGFWETKFADVFQIFYARNQVSYKRRYCALEKTLPTTLSERNPAIRATTADKAQTVPTDSGLHRTESSELELEAVAYICGFCVLAEHVDSIDHHSISPSFETQKLLAQAAAVSPKSFPSRGSFVPAKTLLKNVKNAIKLAINHNEILAIDSK